MSTSNASENIAELAARIGAIRFAMFTTVDQHGHLISHPMTKQETDEHGALWFYTSTHSKLWENIAHRPEVNVSFAEPDHSLFVSVSGRAERVVDRQRIKSMWNPMVSSWFPHGPDDPHVVLVRVRPHAAEYWDSNENKMVGLFEMAKAAITGTTPDVEPGEHGTIRL
jgi:general stress protein 26